LSIIKSDILGCIIYWLYNIDIVGYFLWTSINILSASDVGENQWTVVIERKSNIQHKGISQSGVKWTQKANPTGGPSLYLCGP